MIPFFPKQISIRALILYVGSLALVSLLFMSYVMEPGYLALGVVTVAAFFFLAYLFSHQWQTLTSSRYIAYLLIWAFSLRIAAVTALYFYFLLKTGIPFEFQTADAYAYHLDAEWIASVSHETAYKYIFREGVALSDAGYYISLSELYRLIGPNIFLARVVKCLLSAWTCVLIYKLASRTFGEETGRLAGIFCCLAPNLIYYCGLHLKETEMIFLVVAALEAGARAISSEKSIVLNFLLAAALIAILFFFRTVIALSTALAIGMAFLLWSPKAMSINRRFILIFLSVAAIAAFSGGLISNEVQNNWENRVENQTSKRDQQTAHGNLWAKYATGAVMAPIMFVVSFPTMVDVDQQYNQQMLSGGNYVRNFLGIFVLISMFEALFLKRDWRKTLLLSVFVVAYLGVIAMSGFANSERFVLPALPFLLIFAADGVTNLNANSYRLVKIWYWIVPLMSIGWAVFKLGSRGLL